MNNEKEILTEEELKELAEASKLRKIHSMFNYLDEFGLVGLMETEEIKDMLFTIKLIKTGKVARELGRQSLP